MHWNFYGSGATPQIQLYTPEFPVGTIAELAALHTDYTGKSIARYILKSSGKWLTDPGGNEYFTSTGGLLTQRNVARFVSPTGQQLWPPVGEEVPAAGQPVTPGVQTVKPVLPAAELPAVPAAAAKAAIEAVAQGTMTAAQAAAAVDEGAITVAHPARKRWVIPAAGVGVLVVGGLIGWLVSRK